MEILIFFVVLIILAIFILKGFDKIAGRGPKQVKDGINSSDLNSSQSRESTSSIDVLKQIEAMRKENLITQEEYEKKKKEILDKI